MRKKRNNYSPEEKVMILKRHLIEGEAISKICDELNLQPTVFHRWQKQLFAEGSLVFERHHQRREKKLQQRVDDLEAADLRKLLN